MVKYTNIKIKCYSQIPCCELRGIENTDSGQEADITAVHIKTKAMKLQQYFWSKCRSTLWCKTSSITDFRNESDRQTPKRRKCSGYTTEPVCQTFNWISHIIELLSNWRKHSISYTCSSLLCYVGHEI